MKEFLNENGNTYQIIHEFEFKGNTQAVLYQPEMNQYVYANGLKQDYWGTGNYFSNDKDRAIQYFEEKVTSVIIGQMVEEAQEYLPKMAFNNCVIENGESMGWIEKDGFQDEFTVYFEKSGLELTQELLEQVWKSFPDELVCEQFLDISIENGDINVIVGYDYLYDNEIGMNLGEVSQKVLQNELTVDETVQYFEYYSSYADVTDEMVLSSLHVDKAVPKLTEQLKAFPDQDIEYAKAKYPDVPIIAIQSAYDDNFTNANLIEDRYMKLFELANDIDTPEHVLQELAAMDLDGISDEAIMNQNYDVTKDLYEFCDVTEEEVKNQSKNQNIER